MTILRLSQYKCDRCGHKVIPLPASGLPQGWVRAPGTRSLGPFAAEPAKHYCAFCWAKIHKTGGADA